MTEPQEPSADVEPSPDLEESTDVSVSAAEVEAGAPDGETPTSSASLYEDGDTSGGTGGLDAGGAG